MKTTLQPLSVFINDFNLNAQHKEICFNSTIYFSSILLSLNLESEVQIINLDAKNMNAIYLLNPEVAKSGIPDMFEDHHEEITYLAKKCLIIKGHSVSLGNYVLTIHPTNTTCEQQTLNKLHSKPYIFN
jgi:hypothetical protein